MTDPQVIASELTKLQREDPTTADLAAVERTLSDVERRRMNIGRSLSLIDDEDAAAPLIAELKGLAQRKRELLQEREGIGAQQSLWLHAQHHLTSLQEWIGTVAENAENLTYERKRDLLYALEVQVKLFQSDHTPRFEITASLPLEGNIVTRSSGASSR